MSSTASTSITASPSKGTITTSPSSGIGTATPSTGMTMTTSNSGSLSPLEQEIFALKTQLSAVSAERNVLQETLRNMQGQASPDDCDSSGYNQQSQSGVYEARLTELHSVIAELKKQLDIRREQIIPEESTDFEDDYELDAEDLLSIDENPHLNSTDKSLRMNFINAKTTKSVVDGMGLRSNQNLHRNNHHGQRNNSNNSTILLTTPSDEDELESSSGMIDSSPVANHPNNLPSDVDVDGDYFEDDQIITTEGFGLKCVELNNGHHETDVIDTQGLTTWLDGHKTTLTATTAADSSNCNIESLHNPLNSGLLSSHHKEGKYDRSTRAIIKHHPDKSIDFSPLSSPESPEDNNESPLSLLSGTANIKCGASVEDEEEEDDDHDQGIVVQEKEGYSNDNLHYDDSEVDGDRRGRGEKVEQFGGGGCGRSSGRKLQQQQQQQHNQQIMLNHEHSPQQHRRQVRRHRRNNSKNGMRNRDNNFISQVTNTSGLPPQMIASFSAGGTALENQDRERCNNAHLRENRHHPSTLHAMLSACKKQEKLREEFPTGGGGRGSTTFSGGMDASSPGLLITSMRTTPSESPSPESKPPVQFASLCQEVAQIRQEHAAIKDNLYKKEGELDQTRSALENIAKERDFLKNKVSELEHLLKQSPKRLPRFSPADLAIIPLDDSAPVCKLAERVKLSRQAVSSSPSTPSKQNHQYSPHHVKSQNHGKGQSPGNTLHSSSVIPNSHTNGNDCSPSPEVHRKPSSRHSRSHHKHQHNIQNNNSNGHNHHHSKNHHPHLQPSPQHTPEHQQQQQHCGLTGANLMLIGQSCSTRVVEHLVQPIKSESALREMQHSLSQNGISPLNEEKLREFEIETERLSSKIEHLRSQNDVLTLNLEDAKGNADRLTVLLGKYESNNVALQLAVGYSDHTIEAYDILVALLESELGQLLANLRATGIGANSTPRHHSITDDGLIIPASTTSALSSPNLIPTSCSYSSTNVVHQEQYQPTSITTTPATPITSSCNSSGNNNNSNDNSPTGEPSRTSVVISSSNSNINNGSTDQHREATSTTTTTTTSALILATTTTSTTIPATSASTPLFTGQTGQEELDVRALIERANENRLTAENAARVLLSRFMVESPGSENNNCSSGGGSMVILPGSDHHHHRSNHSHHSGSGNHHHHCPPGQPTIPPLPWEETSSCSQTLSSASSLGDTSNGSPGSKPGSRQGGELIKNEETRIRDLIITLKTERESVKNTVSELESWSLESLYPSKPPSPCDILEARKLDLETAVLMQELMAMREERAELRAQLFLLEKEKTSLELRLQSHETQEEAYKARINYLKSEIQDYQNSISDPLTQQKLLQLSPDGNANNSGGATSPGNTTTTVNPVERELVLKKRIQELASALEKVTHNSKMREKQNHEMISELKRANGILIETLEAVKRKYQSRIRKMEEQIMVIMERHSMQLKLHKDRIHYLELENQEQRSQQQLTSD